MGSIVVHACHEAADEEKEVHRGCVGAGEEYGSDETHTHTETHDTRDEEAGPGQVQQVWEKKRIKSTKLVLRRWLHS